MNTVWAFFFKDKFRTPFSVFKMSLAELLVLCGIIFGTGYGLYKGVSALLNLEGVTEQVSE
jgi:hypothetical protein